MATKEEKATGAMDPDQQPDDVQGVQLGTPVVSKTGMDFGGQAADAPTFALDFKNTAAADREQKSALPAAHGQPQYSSDQLKQWAQALLSKGKAEGSVSEKKTPSTREKIGNALQAAGDKLQQSKGVQITEIPQIQMYQPSQQHMQLMQAWLDSGGFRG